MRTIYKQVLEEVSFQTREFPRGSRVLSIAAQNNEICIWYACDTDNPPAQVEFAIVGTGGDLSTITHTYIGSVQVHNGRLVWHVFAKQLTAEDVVGKGPAVNGNEKVN